MAGRSGVARAVVALPLVTLGRNALVVFWTERVTLSAFDQTTVGDRVVRQVLIDGGLGVDGIRVHLTYTAVVLVIVLAVTGAMRALNWRITL